MSEAKGVQRTEEQVAALRRWQEIERRTGELTARIASRTGNPLVRQFMEIIRVDSAQHHRVQQFIVDTLTTQTMTLQPEELADIWDAIEEHLKLERETIELAKELREGFHSFVHRELLDYLLTDEQKHEKLLTQLEAFKRNMYPYA